MVAKTSLDGIWKLKGVDGGRGSPSAYCTGHLDERTFIDANVPGQVHLDLMRHGIIEDPRVGLNALKARWVEEQYWVYRRTFTPSAEALQARRVWLVFDGLDLVADIHLNGVHVGSHDNAFRPCRLDVTGLLRPGENSLAVALDSGLHAVETRCASEYNNGPDDVLHKRMWLRKPQYQFGWDWNPRLINVGIFRSVRLEWTDTARIDQMTVYPELNDQHDRALLHVRLHVENVTGEPLPTRLRVRVPEAGDACIEQEVNLPPGASTQAITVPVDHPKLWWPRPHGDQPLYQVIGELGVGDQCVDRVARRTGIRSIRINQDPHPVEGRYFILEVNGKPIFAKGGNWVPADMLYGDVNRERYRRLVGLAVEANFNMLRIWGGGLYADHDLLELCDEAGVMVWHDLIFACSKYPAGDPAFLQNVKAEVTRIVRELSPHPSLVVWCGNNELEWGTWEWGYDQGRAFPDYALYHHVFPVIMRQEDPSRPYWPSSPYSPDHQPPNSPIVGDQHPWHVSIGVNRENFWAYRQDVSRFPNEGGALGISSPATLRQFLPEGERYYLSPSWEYHDNTINWHHQVAEIERWLDTWLGLRADALSMEDLAFYSGILQSEALLEYIYNYRRRMFSTASAIFWMYNDSWPTTTSWTIVDYYLRRKLAYHPVRRAFDPLQVIPAIDGDQVTIYGINEMDTHWYGRVCYGLTEMAGRDNLKEISEIVLAPNTVTTLGQFSLATWEQKGYTSWIAYATLENEQGVQRQNRLFMAPYKEMAWTQPDIQISRDGAWATFVSNAFAWGVCLDPEGVSPLADDVFDLLPGIPWRVPWPQEHDLPSIARVANLG